MGKNVETKKQSTKKVAEILPGPSFKAIKKIVTYSENDFAGYREIIQKIFSVITETPVTKNIEIDKEVLTGSVKRKMEYIDEITSDISDHNIQDNIRDLSKILLSPAKAAKKKTFNVEPTLTVSEIEIQKLRALALELVLSQTARSRVGLEVPDYENLSPKGIEVQNFFNDNVNAFGCQTALVAKTVATHLNEKIVTESQEDDEEEFENRFAFGCVEADDNTVLVVGKATAIDPEGEPIYLHDTFVSGPSKDSDVKDFINSMNANVLRSTFSFLELR